MASTKGQGGNGGGADKGKGEPRKNLPTLNLVEFSSEDIDRIVCRKCGNKEHITNQCPALARPAQPTQPQVKVPQRGKGRASAKVRPSTEPAESSAAGERRGTRSTFEYRPRPDNVARATEATDRQDRTEIKAGEAGKAGGGESSKLTVSDGDPLQREGEASTSTQASDHNGKPANISPPKVTESNAKEEKIPKPPSPPPTGTLRPDVGTSGQPIQAIVNFLKVLELPGVLYKYSISPIELKKNVVIKNRVFIGQLIEQVLKKAPFAGHTKHSATDWVSTIITTEEIHLDKENHQICPVSFSHRGAQTTLDIQVNFVEPLRTIDLLKYGEASMEVTPQGFDYTNIVTALNVSHTVSRTNALKDLGEGLHARTGFFTSTRPGDGGALLNINTATSAFFNAPRLDNFIDQCFTLGTRDFLKAGEEKALGAMIKGLKVSLRYDPASHAKLEPLLPGRRIKTITGLGATSVGQQNFWHAEKERDFTVQEYFERELNLRVEWPKLPSINIGSTDPNKKDKHIYVPSEWLYIEPDQPYRGKLSATQTKKMHSHTCNTPTANRRNINEGITRLGVQRPDLLENYGLRIKNELMRIDARLLKHPHLQYANGKLEDPGMAGSWNLRGKAFRKPGTLKKLHILRLRDQSDDRFRKAACKLVSALAACGLGTQGDPYTHNASLPSKGPPQLYFDKLGTALTELRRRGPIRLLVVVLQGEDEYIYSVVKRWADSIIGIPTVCVTEEKFEDRGSRSLGIYGNLALKINIKLEGINHILPEHSHKKLIRTDQVDPPKFGTIIVGADVTHPSRQSIDGCPSIAAVVATIDDQFATYLGSMRLQKSKEEMITDLASMMAERLGAWYKQNSYLPGSILFYRDGVSESQFTQVKQNELPQIKAGCEQARKDIREADRPTSYEPAITLVVVGKRHQTRFYPLDSAKTTKDGVVYNYNFRPGLVVDTRICSPYYFDFYLQSHAGIKGTSRSAHYWVLENGMNFSADELQTLTNELCYNYARATMAVSYVPAAYYADRLCERGRKYLRPLLTNNYEVPEHITHEGLLEKAKNDSDVWRTAQASGNNPWHRDLDKIMFWL